MPPAMMAPPARSVNTLRVTWIERAPRPMPLACASIVVSDPQRDLPEVREHIVVEHDALGRGDLHRRRHLRPVVATLFELTVRPSATRQRVPRPVGGSAFEEGTALLSAYLSTDEGPIQLRVRESNAGGTRSRTGEARVPEIDTRYCSRGSSTLICAGDASAGGRDSNLPAIGSMQN